MGWSTTTAADTYFAGDAVAPEGWGDLNNTEKAQYLDMASNRLDSYAWKEPFETSAKRIADSDIEAMYYELVRHYVERAGRPSQTVVDAGAYTVSVLSDLPLTVASRLLSYIPDLEQLTATGSRTLTPEERAKIVAETAKITAETGLIPTEAEQAAKVERQKIRPIFF